MSGQEQGWSVSRIVHRIGPFVVGLIFIGAIWLLVREVNHYNFSEIREALYQIPRRKVAISFILTVLNYVILMGYDLLAVKSIGHPLPLRRIALASFTGFATSLSFGALLGGGSVRYRLYRAWGLSNSEIVQLVVIMAITFWFGVFALAGVVFLWKPFQISTDWSLPLSTARPLGPPLILLAIAYLVLTVVWKKPIRIGGKDARLPSFAMSAAQLAVAATDLIVAAACLYVLLPESADVSYMHFLGVYLLATVVVVLTHIPGGVGIFELIVLTASPLENKEPLFAAILIFRVMYFLLPLLIAAILFGAYELRLRSQSLRRFFGKPDQTSLPSREGETPAGPPKPERG
jgi:uncharacterized membrane protein YbhN (UPF0104 family)